MNISAFENAYLDRIKTIDQSEEINVLVANALRFVIQNVFSNITNSFVFTVSTSEKTAVEFWLHDTMSKLFATWGFMAVQLIVLDHTMAKLDVPGQRYCNMIMIDSLESLKKTKIAEYNRNSDGLEYYYIFLQMQDHLFQREMQVIFKYCFDNYWIHCNVMLQNSKGEVLVYTYFPFKENQCFQTQPELINQFKDNKFLNDVMFPDKLRNLQGCPLVVSTWPTPPFVEKAKNKAFPNLEIAGCEAAILVAISMNMNFTLDIQWLDVETYYQNKSPEVVPLSKLQNFDTNISMSYFRRTAERDIIGTPTFVTYFMPIVAFILRKKIQHEFMDMLTFPFDTITWILIVVVYTTIGVFNNQHNRKIKSGFFQIFEIIIGIPIPYVPCKTSRRIRLMTILLSSFILRSVYQSLLFFLFRTNFYQSTPITIQGLAESGYKAVATDLTSQFLNFVPQIDDNSLPLIVINNTSEMHPLRYLLHHRNESLVAMSIMEFAIHYVHNELPQGEVLHILPINVKDQQIGFYLPKHSYLSDRLNTHILNLHQSGLLLKWKQWINYENQVQTSSFKRYDNTLLVNLNQLFGFLILIIFLLCMSIFLFVLELLSKRFKCLRRIFGN